MSDKFWVMFWTIALTALFAFTSRSEAAEYSVKFGPSIQNDSTNGSSKLFGIRRQESISFGIHSAFELGGYVDNGGAGRKGAALFKAQLGVTPGPEVGTFAKAFFGPCLISARDTQLGGYGQFCSDIGIGIRDRDSSVTIGYGHISSAGLALPNHGRDFLMFELGLSL